MTDLLQVLPDFPSAQYSHLLPSLDKALVTTSDLLTLDAVEIAKRAQLPLTEVAKLIDTVLQSLHKQFGLRIEPKVNTGAVGEYGIAGQNNPAPFKWNTISTLDATLDAALGGGVPTGYITEITGESGVGKTQYLLTLLLAAQLPQPQGLSKSSLYISTEAVLSTSRLNQLLRMNPILSALPFEAKPSLDKILSIQTPDLESQDHILRYQVPVAVKRHNIGLVVIDSIASNYRAEFERPAAAALTPHNSQRAQLPDRRAGQAMAERRSHLVQLGAHLRNLALTENIVIIVSNQVADRFFPISVSPSHPPHAAPQASGEQMAPEAATITPDPLTLDHQQRWFTGWGDQTPFTPGHTSLKTPSLGLVWINQIAARITLIKDSQGENLSRRRRRWMRVVFAPWTASTSGLGVEFEITGAGIKAVAEADKNV